jgi:hypothetical protein
MCRLEIWEPQAPGNLRACTGITLLFLIVAVNLVKIAVFSYKYIKFRAITAVKIDSE